MKKLIKLAIYAISLTIVSPFVALIYVFKSFQLFLMMGQTFSLIPGEPGRFIRGAYYHLTLDKCPLDVEICFGSYFTKRKVEIGKGVYIGGNCNLGMCKLGDNATIASSVCILSGKNQHGYKQIGVPIQQQQGSYQQVSIGENCWLGHGVIVMANLGKQNVIASGTVITKDTGDFEVWAGNPAQLVKKIQD